MVSCKLSRCVSLLPYEQHRRDVLYKYSKKNCGFFYKKIPENSSCYKQGCCNVALVADGSDPVREQLRRAVHSVVQGVPRQLDPRAQTSRLPQVRESKLNIYVRVYKKKIGS